MCSVIRTMILAVCIVAASSGSTFAESMEPEVRQRLAEDIVKHTGMTMEDLERGDQGNPSMVRTALRNQVDQWISRMEGGMFEPLAVRLTGERIFANTGLLAEGKHWTVDSRLPIAVERQIQARKLLEDERYDKLSSLLVSYALADGATSEMRDLVIVFLGRSLAQIEVVDMLEQELLTAPYNETDNRRRSAALAIALLYLDRTAFRKAATEAISDEELPSYWRRQSLEALLHTSPPEQRNAVISIGVDADNINVADLLFRLDEARTGSSDLLRHAMVDWHGRVAATVEKEPGRSKDAENFYMNLALGVMSLGRNGSLEPEERSAVANQARILITHGSGTLCDSAVDVLSAAGSDLEDGGYMASLLHHSRSRVRAGSASALGRSFPQTRGKHLATLANLLDDPEERVRANALYALWREHEPEKAHNMFFATGTFEQQKAATLAWLKEHRDIEPAVKAEMEEQ